MNWLTHHGALLLIFVGGLISALGSFFAARIPNKSAQRKRMPTLTVWILLGAVIGICGTYWAGYQQDQLASYLSGGDSYGVVSMGPLTEHEFAYLFQNRGNQPLYDVYVDIRDITKWKTLWLANGFPAEALDPKSHWQSSDIPTDKTLEMLRQVTTTIPVGNVAPGQLRQVWSTSAPPVADQEYSISIFARNGLVSQTLLIHRNQNGWTWASKSWRTPISSKDGWWKIPLDETVLKDFPKDRITW